MGVFWLGPRARGRTVDVQVGLRATACVDFVQFAIAQDRARARFAKIAPSGTAVRYTGQLPDGGYRLRVALLCADDAIVEVLERPLDVQDDLTVPVTVTATCGCGGAA